MDNSYGIDEIETITRKPRCFPNKIQAFKPPLVKVSSKFPSKISLTQESDSNFFETYGEGEPTGSELTCTTDFKPPITHWKRADFTDVDAINTLIGNSNGIMSDLFGEPDVPDLIEKSNFAMIQFNSKEKVISFLSVFAYPNIPAVPSFEWFSWLEGSYRLKNANPRNCYFIHYMIWDSDYYKDFLKLSLETIFLEHLFLNNIIIIKPPKVKIPNILSELFIQVLPIDSKLFECGPDSLQTMFICLKHSIMERLKIRLAIVEDHEDLMPIVEQHTTRLKELYGDFCMAEIIEYPGTKDRKTLVCESQGYAVGFMNVNRYVDLDLLNSQFDLGVFHGLRKPSSDDKMAQHISIQDDDTPIYLADTIEPSLQLVDSNAMLKFLNWQPSLCASKEDLDVDSSSSSEPPKRYYALTNSMQDLIQETLDVKLAPKFSAHALSLMSSKSQDVMEESTATNTGAPDTDKFSEAEESHVTVQSSLMSLQNFNLPTYNGPPNAFCIEFFAMHNDFDQRLCQDFLEAAFEVFPDLEYCLLTIPSQSPTFPLLDYFVRITPRPLKRFKQELYVCHKSAIMVTFMRVRRLVKSDLKDIAHLLTGIRNNETIFADIASSCYYEDSAYQGFVLICSKSIVGAAVLCNEYGMEYLAHQYHVSDLIDFDLHKIDYHAILKHLVLSPIYQSHARFFLRDVMRMADVTSLYRTRYEEVESNWFKSSLITVLGQLIPVKPRRMVKYHEDSLGENLPPHYFLHRDMPFSLYHINSRVCSMKKFTCNINLVIVGASRTTFSFLETLLFAPSSAYVTYTNITLVSPHGMGTELPSQPARDLMFPFQGKFDRFYKIQMCLKTYVHYVYGVMTEINRDEKYIMINNECIVPYDYLVLLCGKQFVMPVPYALMANTNDCRRNYRPRCSLYKYLSRADQKHHETESVWPPNIFLINSDVDATNAFISLQYLVQKRKGFPQEEKIIIYGHSLSVYLCVNSLIQYGIPPEVIVLVEPFPTGTFSVSCFLDNNIDEAVLKTIKELGVDHYKGYILYDWTLCEKNKQLQTATFHSNNRRVTLKCLAMFPFERKLVSEVTFKAVNEASLVYDGRLVIDNCFQTNDSHIYAAGSLTKYKRKYFANDKNHRYFNANEVGKYLGDIIRRKIDPTEDAMEEEKSELVPNMTDPLLTYGQLPGNWKYFRLTKPGKSQDPETRAALKEYGDVLVTGDCEMSKGYGYFKLILDDCGFVEGIFCYTKDEIDVQNLEILYGKHEKLLNDLLMRFGLGMIKDFYSYFREPWVYAIFHDHFELVLHKNNELFLQERFSVSRKTILDTVVKALKANNWMKPNEKKMKEIKDRYEESEVQQKITEHILDFLYYYDEPFPMYATPRILRVLLHNANTSLLHKAIGESSGSKPAVRITETVHHM